MKKLFTFILVTLLATTVAWADNVYVKVTSKDQLVAGNKNKYILVRNYESGSTKTVYFAGKYGSYFKPVAKTVSEFSDSYDLDALRVSGVNELVLGEAVEPEEPKEAWTFMTNTTNSSGLNYFVAHDVEYNNNYDERFTTITSENNVKAEWQIAETSNGFVVTKKVKKVEDDVVVEVKMGVIGQKTIITDTSSKRIYFYEEGTQTDFVLYVQMPESESSLEVSPTELNLDTYESGTFSGTFTVTGKNLVEDVTITLDEDESDEGFTITPTNITAAAEINQTVTVSYTGTAPKARAKVQVTSGDLTEVVLVEVDIPGTLEVSTDNLNMGYYNSASFTLSGSYLAEDVAISVKDGSDPGFTVTPTSATIVDGTLADTEVTVSYDGLTDASATIVITSGTLTKEVNVTAQAFTIYIDKTSTGYFYAWNSEGEPNAESPGVEIVADNFEKTATVDGIECYAYRFNGEGAGIVFSDNNGHQTETITPEAGKVYKYISGNNWCTTPLSFALTETSTGYIYVWDENATDENDKYEPLGAMPGTPMEHFEMGELVRPVTVDVRVSSVNTTYNPFVIFSDGNDQTDALELIAGKVYSFPDEEGIEINETNFPDPIFRQYVAETYDLNGSGVLTPNEINKARKMTLLTSNDPEYANISTLQGIEYFTELTWLNTSGLDNVTAIDLSHNVKLDSVWIGMAITSIDVSMLTKMTELNLKDATKLTGAIVDLTNNNLLKLLNMADNCGRYNLIMGLDNTKSQLHVITTPHQYYEGNVLNLEGCEELYYLNVQNCRLEHLNVKGCKVLGDRSLGGNALNTVFHIYQNYLRALDLEGVNLSYNYNLTNKDAPYASLFPKTEYIAHSAYNDQFPPTLTPNVALVYHDRWAATPNYTYLVYVRLDENKNDKDPKTGKPVPTLNELFRQEAQERLKNADIPIEEVVAQIDNVADPGFDYHRVKLWSRFATTKDGPVLDKVHGTTEIHALTGVSEVNWSESETMPDLSQVDPTHVLGNVLSLGMYTVPCGHDRRYHETSGAEGTTAEVEPAYVGGTVSYLYSTLDWTKEPDETPDGPSKLPMRDGGTEPDGIDDDVYDSYNGTAITAETAYYTGITVQKNAVVKKYDNAIPFDFDWKVKLTNDPESIVTAIEGIHSDLPALIEEIQYYNVMGQMSHKPFDGVNIVVTRYSNGTTTTKKVIR